MKGGVLAVTIAACAITTFSLALRAQAPVAADAPSFVASVKPNRSASGMEIRIDPGHINMVGVPVRQLVRQGYQLQDFQIVGGPPWASTERFDIQVNVDGPFQPGQLSSLLRALLADRFQLAARRETREMPIYSLVVARPDRGLGPGLKPSTPECATSIEARVRRGPDPGGPPPGAFGPGSGPLGAGPAVGPGNAPTDFNQAPPCGGMRGFPGGQIASGMRVAQLVPMLSQQTGRVVVDRTGLTGVYDVDLHWTPDSTQRLEGAPPPGAPPIPPIDPNGPSLFAAIEEQLGLKLENQRAAVDVLVIERVERPAEN